MDEQPISKPIFVIAIVIVIFIAIGGIFLIINLTKSDESSVQAFDDSAHNELIQNTLLSRKEQTINSIISSSQTQSQSNEENNSYYQIKDFVVYFKDANNRFSGQTYSHSNSGNLNSLIYNYDYTNFCVGCLYPSNWQVSGYAHSAGSNTYSTVSASKDSGNHEDVSLYIYELDISNYPNYSTDHYLHLLEDKIRNYPNELGYGSVSNFNISDSTYKSVTRKLLTYDITLSKYYAYRVWNTIEVSDDHMYILTVSIPTNKINDDTLETKDIIIHSLSGSALNI